MFPVMRDFQRDKEILFGGGGCSYFTQGQTKAIGDGSIQLPQIVAPPETKEQDNGKIRTKFLSKRKRKVPIVEGENSIFFPLLRVLNEYLA